MFFMSLNDKGKPFLVNLDKVLYIGRQDEDCTVFYCGADDEWSIDMPLEEVIKVLNRTGVVLDADIVWGEIYDEEEAELIREKEIKGGSTLSFAVPRDTTDE